MASGVTLHWLRPDEVKDAQQWDAYVEQAPAGTFFHLSGWQQLLEDLYGHKSYYLYARRAGCVVGVLPLARVQSRLFDDALISTPFCVYGGVVAEDHGVVTALLDAARDLTARLNVAHLELRNTTPLDTQWVPKPLYATFKKAISEDAQANLKAIPRKQRAEVRRGIKSGLVSRVMEDPDPCYELYAVSLRNLGTPVFPRGHFHHLKKIFADRCEMTVLEHQGRAVSGVMSFYFKDQVLPYYGGALPAARKVGAYPYMYYDLMNRAAAQGRRVFDFGRSKVGTGAYAFKRFYGFEATPLYYGYHLYHSRALPDLNPLNPKYQRFIALWKRLPITVANRLGPVLARSLG
ncbi:FemAB family XrtA/PEP-CTERM system-associated protein [Magnetococcus sp. PR-3]|uniref:FemAB family XrtA/PEP-CTERM system-associated protein n=1 Tax=Magnetococcus sp. PR-3 TaxID=3120355 RepID=UPI002FCDF42E